MKNDEKRLLGLWEGHTHALAELRYAEIQLQELEVVKAENQGLNNIINLAEDTITDLKKALALVKPWGAQIGQWQATCSACRKSFNMPCQHMCCGFLINADGTKA